jgi:heme oxygenase
LRSATRLHHQRVDEIYSAAQMGEVRSYGLFLLAQAAAHIPVERALERGGVGELVPDWKNRSRREALAADLLALGLQSPLPLEDPLYEGTEALLGALYVIEGSRLGGTLLKRSVPSTFPTRFLGNVDSSAWQALLAQLDDQLDTESKRATAIAAAQNVFALFEASGRRYLGSGYSAV